jgi:alpha-glucoside transport system substrate-binding protein
MQHRRRRGPARTLLTLVLALALLGAACADDDDGGDESSGGGGGDGGGGDMVVTMAGPEVEVEAQGLVDSFAAFEEETGITIEYSGDRSFEEQIGGQVDGGNPPDIAFFPQPGKIRDFQEDLVPIPEDIAGGFTGLPEGLLDLATIDGDLYGVPAKADLKSLVWYDPAAFEEKGYTVPETMEDLLDQADEMIANGDTPFCIGIGSDAATGWPMTDWIEDFMLRLKGPEVYDQWVNHEIPFDDPDVVEVVEYVYDLWSTEGMVYGGLENIAATPFADAGLPLLDGECMMHRQGNFYAANWPEGTEIGEDGQVNAFYLPTFADQDFGQVTLSGGIYAAAFSDRPEVMQVIEFIGSVDYADARAPVGGFLAPNQDTDTSLYPSEIEQTFAEILADADPVRFDASDLMPGAVGAGTFWTAAVDIVSGNKTVEEALTSVEESWPSS